MYLEVDHYLTAQPENRIWILCEVNTAAVDFRGLNSTARNLQSLPWPAGWGGGRRGRELVTQVENSLLIWNV